MLRRTAAETRHGAARGFFRLRRLPAGRGLLSAGRSCSRRRFRDAYLLRRHRQERQLELAALQAELRLLGQTERFLSWFNPQEEALEPAASMVEAQS